MLLAPLLRLNALVPEYDPLPYELLDCDDEGRAPTLPVEGRAPTVPVEGRAPTFPVEGRVPTLPVDGRVPTFPVDGRVPMFPVEGLAPPELQPRASRVFALAPLCRIRF